MYICWIVLSISHALQNPKLLDLECLVFPYYVESKQAKEVLYPKWIHSLSSNIVAAISGLICLKSGTQFGNGWFVSHRECVQWLGLSDTQRGEETRLDRWEITFFFKFYYCSGGEDRGWKQSWGVSECSQSLYWNDWAEDQCQPGTQLTDPFTKFTDFFRLMWDALRKRSFCLKAHNC